MTARKFRRTRRRRCQIVRSLRYHDSDGHENVAYKVNLRSFIHYRDYSNSFTLSNVSELSVLSRIPKNYIQVQREKDNLAIACLRPPQNVK